MARADPRKDVVIIGLGWTGSILAMELAKQGLDILALERGSDREMVPDFQYPKVINELKYGIRFGFMRKPRNSTLAIRGTLGEAAREEVFQPADLVIGTAYSPHNVHLILLSGIGEPWNPIVQTCTTSKNYAYSRSSETLTSLGVARTATGSVGLIRTPNTRVQGSEMETPSRSAAAHTTHPKIAVEAKTPRVAMKPMVTARLRRAGTSTCSTPANNRNVSMPFNTGLWKSTCRKSAARFS